MRSFISVSSLTLALVLVSHASFANDPPAPSAKSPSTAEVLGKLHKSNVKEIRMGEMARDHGHAKDVQDFGKTLIKDHTDADTKVAKLAKAENIDLAANTPAVGSTDMPMGAGFDAAFAKDMLEDHKKDIAEVEAARDATQDNKLKALLKDILPVLKKHESIAQKLVDQQKKS